jgi:hypothetical protein
MVVPTQLADKRKVTPKEVPIVEVPVVQAGTVVPLVNHSQEAHVVPVAEGALATVIPAN